MVIQRLQTLYLLLAAIMMAAFAFCPSVLISHDGQQYVLSALASGIAGNTHPDMLLSAITALAFILTIVTIFKYKDLKLQLKLCSITAALSITLLIVVAIIAITQRNTEYQIEPTFYNILPVLAFVCYILAYRGVKHDKKLLSSSERLR